MENINPTDLLRHVENEAEVLNAAHNSITNELQRLQVEEDMLMRTFHNLLSAQGLIKKRESTDAGSLSHNNQVPEASTAASLGDGNCNARGSQLDTHHNQGSMALTTTSHQVEKWDEGGSPLETNHTQISKSSLVTAQEDGNLAAKKEQIRN